MRRGPFVQTGHRRLEGNGPAVLFITLDGAERQTQCEGRIRIRRGLLQVQSGPRNLGMGLLLDLVLRLDNLAHRPRRRVNQSGQFDHRIARPGHLGRRRAVELLAKRHILQFRPGDQLGRPIPRRLARQHLLDQRVRIAQLLDQPRQRIGQLEPLEILVDRFGREELELQRFQVRISILPQTLPRWACPSRPPLEESFAPIPNKVLWKPLAPSSRRCLNAFWAMIRCASAMSSQAGRMSLA